MRKELPFWAKALYNMDEVIHVTYENTSPIGIFDSGVGGISVLKAGQSWLYPMRILFIMPIRPISLMGTMTPQ